MTTVMLAAVFAFALIGIVVFSVISKKVEIIKIWRLGFIIMTVGFIPLYFAKNLPTAIVIAGVMGVGVAGCLITMDCIGAKIIDNDYERHGVKREGMLTSLIGVMNRLNGLYVALGYKIMYSVFGFKNDLEPGTQPDIASKFLLCVLPFVAMLLASIFSMFLHFDKKEEPEAASVSADE